MNYPHYGPCIDTDHIDRQRAWSERTFGPGAMNRGCGHGLAGDALGCRWCLTWSSFLFRRR